MAYEPTTGAGLSNGMVTLVGPASVITGLPAQPSSGVPMTQLPLRVSKKSINAGHSPTWTVTGRKSSGRYVEKPPYVSDVA